jgi:hypothetical protein
MDQEPLTAGLRLRLESEGGGGNADPSAPGLADTQPAEEIQQRMGGAGIPSS